MRYGSHRTVEWFALILLLFRVCFRNFDFLHLFKKTFNILCQSLRREVVLRPISTTSFGEIVFCFIDFFAKRSNKTNKEYSRQRLWWKRAFRLQTGFLIFLFVVYYCC